jgi:uncharacterized integral membrane protein
MRILYLLLLIIFLGAIAIFAWQNTEPTVMRFLNQSMSAPLAAVIAGVYVLGMFSGWTVVGLLKRSIRRVAERPKV